MGEEGLVCPLVCCKVSHSCPAIHGLSQYGIGFLVLEDEEVLGAVDGRGGEAAW